jgi:DNA-binding response OmpR family regulator
MRKQEPEKVKPPMNILLIDDDVLVCEALAHALAVADYQVVPAANQYDAFRKLRNDEIDVVLLDVHPRHEDGLDTARRLNVLRPELPIIAMSARLEQNELTSRNHRFRAVLAKPLNLAGLIGILDDVSSKIPARRPCASSDLCAVAA